MKLHTTTEIAAMIGMTRDGVHKRLKRLSLTPTIVGKTRGYTAAQVEQIRNCERGKPGRKPKAK